MDPTTDEPVAGAIRGSSEDDRDATDTTGSHPRVGAARCRGQRAGPIVVWIGRVTIPATITPAAKPNKAAGTAGAVRQQTDLSDLAAHHLPGSWRGIGPPMRSGASHRRANCAFRWKPDTDSRPDASSFAGMLAERPPTGFNRRSGGQPAWGLPETHGRGIRIRSRNGRAIRQPRPSAPGSRRRPALPTAAPRCPRRNAMPPCAATAPAHARDLPCDLARTLAPALVRASA